jgi:hypothetical protein
VPDICSPDFADMIFAWSTQVLAVVLVVVLAIVLCDAGPRQASRGILPSREG